MNVALLSPMALGALAALLVPLAIHLARKSEQEPTIFAALRWLQEKPKPRSRLRFDERLLLLVRLALLLLAVMWLARPVLTGGQDTRPFTAVVPGARIDTASLPGGRVHWLAPDFPAVDAPPASIPLPVGSLLRELDARLPSGTPLTIYTPAVIDGTDGERPHLSREVKWKIVDGDMRKPRGTIPFPAISLRSDGEHAGGVRYLRAAVTAWSPADAASRVTVQPPTAALPNTAARLFWMIGGTLPDPVIEWIGRGGTALVAGDTLWPSNVKPVPVWLDRQALPLAEAVALGKGRLIRLTRRVAPSEMPFLLEAEFPQQLDALVNPRRPSTTAMASTYAPLKVGKSVSQPDPVPLRPWLAALLVLVLCLERWLATRRVRGMAP